MWVDELQLLPPLVLSTLVQPLGEKGFLGWEGQRLPTEQLVLVLNAHVPSVMSTEFAQLDAADVSDLLKLQFEQLLQHSDHANSAVPAALARRVDFLLPLCN